MTVEQLLKQKLWQEIERLPLYRLQQVLDFVSFLRSRSEYHLSPPEETKPVLDAEADPLLEFVGSISHGSLAQDIDEELYSS